MASHSLFARARVTLLAGLALVIGLASLAGCAATPNDPAPSSQSTDPNVGSISMDLTVGGGYKFAQVSYDVSGNGFHKAASIDVSASATLATVVGGIPFGTGYKLQLNAQDTAHALTPCVGSATFDIASAATTTVPVHLTCHQVPQTTAAAVPVPRWATAALAGLLLALGASGARRRGRAAR
jgi:hypothetical protein